MTVVDRRADRGLSTICAADSSNGCTDGPRARIGANAHRIVMEQLVHHFDTAVVDAGDQPFDYVLIGAGFSNNLT